MNNNANRLNSPISTWRSAISHAADWCSAVLLIGVTGALIAQGHDGLALALGFAGAVFVWAVFIGPMVAPTREGHAGATLPAILADRFGSPTVGAAASAFMLVALTGLLAAEITVIAGALRLLLVWEPLALGLAMSAIVTGLVLALLPPRTLHQIVPVVIVLSLMAVLFSTLAWLGWAGGIGTLISSPQISDIVALEQSMLEKRLADPSNFKPHAVPFLRTDALNFASLILCLSVGLAILATPARQASPPTMDHSATAYARAALIVTAILVALPPIAAAAKLTLLKLVASGLKPTALPAWMQDYRDGGGLQICAGNSADAASLAKACGKGVGPQGFMRWHEVAFAPDAMVFAALDASGPGANAMKIAIVVIAVAAAIWTARRLARLVIGIVAPAHGVERRTPFAKVALLLGLLACAAVGIVVAKPADAVTLLAWSASLAVATIAPALLAARIYRRPSPTAALVSMAGAATVTGLMVIGTTLAPVEVYSWTGSISSAPVSVSRKLANLESTWASASQGPGKDALRLQAVKLARENLNWFGLKPLAVGTAGFVLGTIVVLLGSALVAGRLPRPSR